MKQLLWFSLIFIVGCGSGGGGSSDPEPSEAASNPVSSADTVNPQNDTPSTSDASGDQSGDQSTTPDEDGATTPVVVTTPPIVAEDDGFATPERVARFMTQATFGPTPNQPESLRGTSASAWIKQEFEKPPTFYLPGLNQLPETMPAGGTGFWRQAILAEDQLRQRMVYALSQIIVVSDFGGETLSDVRVAVPYYQDVLTQHAFGNYRDLLEAITYTPAMGHYLTYLGNLKGDPATGRVPDENYAREILQLFSIGLLGLNPDGSVQRDSNGNPVEIYDNRDITGLARVFTGLDFAADRSDLTDEEVEFDLWVQPMRMYEANHSTLEKTFLGQTIPAGTSGAESIRRALDVIFAHPNLAPFIGRQLIQRFVTSHPAPEYIARVSAAFNSGSYQLPDGTAVGEGQRGDLKATLAAVLFDEQARSDSARQANTFGKLREPAIRLANWARATGVTNPAAGYIELLFDANSPTALSQRPFGAKSVFNFYRPGYVAPGTTTGAAGLTMPELQIVNAASLAGFPNFLEFFLYAEVTDPEYQQVLREQFAEDEIQFDAEAAATAFVPDYTPLEALAGQPEALLDRLNLLFTYGQMSNDTRTAIIDILREFRREDVSSAETVAMAIYLVMTSPDYLLQG